jgi:hypothetical protein
MKKKSLETKTFIKIKEEKVNKPIYAKFELNQEKSNKENIQK